MSEQAFTALAAELQSRQRLLVVSHYSPDPDAFGSSCGLTLGLRAAGKHAVCLNEDGPVQHLRYIPGAGEIGSTIPAGEWDAVVACDCGDKRRIGERLGAALRDLPLFNIDHHVSNEGFGAVNLVLPEASSTSEIVYTLLTLLRVDITPEIAECLLTGITADTGGFRYSSTGARTFAVAERLVTAGAVPQRIADNLYGNRRLAAVKLHADALRRLKMHAGGRVAELFVSEEMLSDLGAAPEDCENLVEAGRDIAGVQIAVLIRRDSGLWKVSMRSKSEEYDVSAVARSFGGGGHRQAAAFRWRKELSELRERLLAALEALAAGGGRA